MNRWSNTKTLFLGIFIIFLVLTVASESLLKKFLGPHHNPLTRDIYCENYENCLHEAAHQMDQELGWVSKSEEWQKAVHINSYINSKYPELRTPIKEKMALFPGIGTPRLPMTNNLIFGEFSLAGGWGGYTELYASLVEWSEGDLNKIPTEYRHFFNWPLLEAILRRTGFLIPASSPLF